MMALHPKIASMIEMARAHHRPPFHQCTPDQARSLLSASAAALGSGPDVHQVQDIHVSVRWGSIPARLYRSAEKETGLIVYLHGGGWCLGSIADFDALCRLICQQSRCAVLLLDYRLAPEFPYPSGLEDAIDTIEWAWLGRQNLAGASVPIVVAGDSAGGNLAAVAVNELSPYIPIAMQLLVYPVTSSNFDTPSYQQFSKGYPLTREDMQWFFRHYASPDIWESHRISPVNANVLAHIPPTWIGIADHDVLRDDGIRYAELLKRSVAKVDLRVYPGMTHGFIRMANLVDVARDAVCDMAHAAREGCIVWQNQYQSN